MHDYTRAIPQASLRADEDKRRVWGVVIRSLDPVDGMIDQADLERIDTYNTFFRRETVEAMQEAYQEHFRVVDADHDYTPGKGVIVQTVYNDEPAHGLPGNAWIVAAKPSPEELARFESGEHTGFSMATREDRIPVTLTIRETGEQIDVEEVVNPVCSYISFVSRGANKQQVVIREDASDMKPSSIWNRVKSTIREYMGAASGDAVREWYEAPFLFGDKWDDVEKSRLFSSALWLYEDSLYSIMYSGDADKAGMIATSTAAFVAAINPLAASLGTEALREGQDTADTVTDPIGGESETNRNDQDGDIDMTPEELTAAIQAANAPVMARLDALETAKTEPVTPKADEPVDELTKLREEKAAADAKNAEVARELAELKAARETAPASTDADPGKDKTQEVRSKIVLSEAQIAFGRSCGIDVQKETDITGLFITSRRS